MAPCVARYSWSAGRGGGVRKRESIYGDSEEAQGGARSANGSAWGQDGTAIAADDGQAARRAARLARRQQRQAWGYEQQPATAAQEAAAPAGYPRAVQQASQGWEAGAGKAERGRRGPSRRRQRSAEADPQLRDAWAEEWGPNVGAPPGVMDAWAEESWGRDLGGGEWEREQEEAEQERQRRARDEAEAGPGSAWDYLQRGQGWGSPRRARRRAAAAAADAAEEEADAAAAAARPRHTVGSAGGWRQAPERRRPRPEEDEPGDSSSAFADAYASPAAAAAAAGRRRRAWDDAAADEDEEAARGAAAWEANAAPEDAEAEALVAPDIVLLNPSEADRVLPVVPSADQAAYFTGSSADAVQRWAGSLALTVLMSKVVAMLAATSLTWPLWWPWARAASRNYSLRKDLRYVLELAFSGRPKPAWGAGLEGGALGGNALGGGAYNNMRLSRFLVGDPGGAYTEVTLPYDSRYELVRPGEPVELVVLAADPSFATFKAVKDCYLPTSGLWLAEYPFLDRRAESGARGGERGGVARKGVPGWPARAEGRGAAPPASLLSIACSCSRLHARAHAVPRRSEFLEMSLEVERESQLAADGFAPGHSQAAYEPAVYDVEASAAGPGSWDQQAGGGWQEAEVWDGAQQQQQQQQPGSWEAGGGGGGASDPQQRWRPPPGQGYSSPY
eukprot:scaffold1.g5570.t1